MKFNSDEVLTLAEIRTAKGLHKSELSRLLHVTPQYYGDVEAGRRKPTVDVLHRMAALFGTSMDFMYHALNKQRVVWHFPDAYLEYGMRAAIQRDTEYLRERHAVSARKGESDVD